MYECRAVDVHAYVTECIAQTEEYIVATGCTHTSMGGRKLQQLTFVSLFACLQV